MLSLEIVLSTFFPLPRYFPHLSMLVLVYAALQEGVFSGIKFGLWLGLLIDMVSLEHLGMYTFLYAVVGALCGVLRGKVFAEAFISQWLIPSGAYLIVLSTIFLSTPFLDEPRNRLPLFWEMVKHSALLTTLLVSPFVFAFCGKILRIKRVTPRHMFLS